ncbi:unnamed protein product [Dicrocoelium dendriticum]|nr:unnamed protein product [Dicrocoelium dendriticum]
MWNLQHTNNEDRSKKTPAFKKWGVLYSGITWMQKLRKTASSTPSNEPDVPTSEAVGLKSITAKNKPNRWKRLLSTTRTESYRNIDPISPTSKPPRQNTGQQYYTPGTPAARLLKSASVGDYARLVPRAEVNTSLRGCTTTNQPEQVHSFSYSSGLPNRASAENVYPLFWPSHGNPLPSPSLDMHKLAFLQKSEDSTVDRTDCESTLEPSDSSQGTDHQFGSQTGSTNATKSMSGSAQPDANDSESMESRENQEEMKTIMHRERRRAVIEDDHFQWNSEEEASNAGSTAAAAESETSTSKSTGELVSSVGFFGGQRRGLLRKQRTVAELLARSQTLNASSEFDTKTRKKAILKLAESRSRSKDLVLDIGEALSKLTPSTFTDTYLESFRNSHWSQITTNGSVPATEEGPMPTRREVLRREAVWELFKSELIFFTDHLLVLKNCFMEPLKKLQVDGYLMFVEPSDLYGNLDDLCYVSHSLCRELLGNLSRDSRVKDFGNTNVLLQTLKRWSEHSRDGEVYHTYCLNYDSALVYLDTLRTNEQFTEYERWCEQDPRCRRLQLTDLLVAPIQHYMKIPLMLTGIRGYTADKAEQDMLQNCLEKVDKALKSLENKMQWLKSFERLQEIQTQLVWPSVSELEPKVFIPDCLKPKVAKQPCERLIATPRRNLLHEGPLTLIDGNKVIETYTFLFDDFLLLTKVKKHPKKNIGDDAVYIVHRQAIALDRFMLHELSSAEEHEDAVQSSGAVNAVSSHLAAIDVDKKHM